MEYLSGLDYAIIVIYFCALVGLGLYLKGRASASLEDYLVGGRQLPWWAIGMSGMASFLDIAGTMIITSFLFMLGPRGLFVEFRGGAVLVLVFMMLWAGKWHRRSNCLTSAEWMIFRFGDGPGGRFAEFIRVVAGIVMTVGMLAYLIKAVGLFLSMFLPFSPLACALVMVGVASLYTMVSGFYGVVFTDIFQSAIILIAVVFISVLAFMKVTDAGSLTEIAIAVTGNEQWMRSVPHWKTTMPPVYDAYQDLFMFAFFYLMRNVFSGMGVGDDPKFFGARSDSECSKLAFLWTWLMMFRWPMMMGFAVLGIYLAHDLFPDQQVLRDSAALIKTHVPHALKSDWPALLSRIIHSSGTDSSELLDGLR
ncbi:MAG: sodium:solute symporter, partial [Candidatus Hydrogenedentes bacterium]|nr:sodium:solute symporter [Candidatus Hydrogenedentota bacterium]